MLISRTKVIAHLDRFLSPEDRKHIDLMTDLCWAAAVTLEFGFECPEEQQADAKEKYFGLIQKFSDAREKAEVPVTMEEYNYQPVFPQERQPTTEDLALVCDLFHKLTVQESKVSKEKLLEWLKEAWGGGAHQQRVYSMEVEGGIMNEFGTVANFGADLAMFGASKGLLPAKA